MPSQPPPIPQKNETPQLPPKPNGINQQTIQANTKSPEQSHIAPQKQPPSAPSKTAPQPTIAQSTNQVPTKSLPPTPQKATIQTSTQSAPQSNEAAMPAEVPSPTQSTQSAPQTATQPTKENKTAEFSSGGNKPIETDTISQDSEPTPITQGTQNELDNLLKKLEGLQESEKVTELVDYLQAARILGFEATAKAMINLVQKELEETPKINNKPSIKDTKSLTEKIKKQKEMIKKQNNTEFFEDLEKKITLLKPEDDNFYESYLEIVEKMQDWLEDNIPQDDEKYKDINTYLNLTKNGQIKNKQKHLQQTLAAMKKIPMNRI